MFKNILFVCVGNVCRSPMAEVILRAKRSDLEVSSAGLGALVGNPAEPNTVEVLKQHGFTDCDHIARQINHEIIMAADLILTMDSWQSLNIAEKFPVARGRTFMLGKWNNNEEISDPYQLPLEASQLTFDRIIHNINSWVKHVPI